MVVGFFGLALKGYVGWSTRAGYWMSVWSIYQHACRGGCQHQLVAASFNWLLIALSLRRDVIIIILIIIVPGC